MAVCCSRRLGQLAVARLQFLEEAAILDGDHRLVGEGLQQLDVSVPRKAPDGFARPRCFLAPSPPAASARRARCESRWPPLHGARRCSGFCETVWDVDHLAREDRAHRPRPIARGHRERAGDRESKETFPSAATWINLPSNRQTPETVASQSRQACSAIVSNTGWTSVGELEITRRISPVAVCCSRLSVRLAVARLQLFEQPDVLDGDDRLIGEGLEELDLSSGKSPVADRITLIAPMGWPSRSIGTARHSESPPLPKAPHRAGHRYATWVGSACTSEIWTTLRCRIARPVAVSSSAGRGRAPRSAASPSGVRPDRRRSAPFSVNRTTKQNSPSHRCWRSGRACRTPAGRRSATGDDPQDLGRRRLLLQASVSSRLRASSSWNRRTFSMAMTAWSAKVWSRATCRVRERAGPRCGGR